MHYTTWLNFPKKIIRIYTKRQSAQVNGQKAHAYDFLEQMSLAYNLLHPRTLSNYQKQVWCAHRHMEIQKVKRNSFNCMCLLRKKYILIPLIYTKEISYVSVVWGFFQGINNIKLLQTFNKCLPTNTRSSASVQIKIGKEFINV